jgi:hypothetical protein
MTELTLDEFKRSTWKGKPVAEMSRNELIEAFCETFNCLKKVRQGLQEETPAHLVRA